MYIWSVYVNRTIYIIIYIINGRLKAYINRTVGFFLCHNPAFPPQLVLVTRIPFCQPGVEGLEKEKFYRTQELDNINTDYIVCTTRSKWWIRLNEQKGRDLLKRHREERHSGRLIKWIRPICPTQGQSGKRRKLNSPPGLPTPTRAQATTDCEIINMVKTLNGAIAAVSQDTARIQRAYDQLRAENMGRDKALANLSEMVKEYGSSPVNMRPHPVIQADVLDEEGNLHAADIGITWENNEIFLHGVRVVGPGPPRPTGMGPVMSTPYQPMRKQDRDNTSTTALPPTPRTPEAVPDADIQIRRPPPEIRQGYRPAAPIQRFNNKSLNWPAWFRHFRAVADVHGWSKDQRALQLVSYLDEAAMNNYDVLVKLLSDRFDPASRVSAFRSRFHGRSRRHHEDADAFADALAELCRVGYP